MSKLGTVKRFFTTLAVRNELAQKDELVLKLRQELGDAEHSRAVAERNLKQALTENERRAEDNDKILSELWEMEIYLTEVEDDRAEIMLDMMDLERRYETVLEYSQGK